MNRERKNNGENTAVAHTKTNESFKKREKGKNGWVWQESAQKMEDI